MTSLLANSFISKTVKKGIFWIAIGHEPTDYSNSFLIVFTYSRMALSFSESWFFEFFLNSKIAFSILSSVSFIISVMLETMLQLVSSFVKIYYI